LTQLPTIPLKLQADSVEAALNIGADIVPNFPLNAGDLLISPKILTYQSTELVVESATVAGAGTPNVNGVYERNFNTNKKPAYNRVASGSYVASIRWFDDGISRFWYIMATPQNIGSGEQLIYKNDGSLNDAYLRYTSTQDVPTPNLVTTWVLAGTPGSVSPLPQSITIQPGEPGDYVRRLNVGIPSPDPINPGKVRYELSFSASGNNRIVDIYQISVRRTDIPNSPWIIASNILLKDMLGTPSFPSCTVGNLDPSPAVYEFRVIALSTLGGFRYVRSDGATVFLDSKFVGATSAMNGLPGLVPEATPADRLNYLCGDGTWKNPSSQSVTEGFVIAMAISL
jgi:hypothetical protein